MAIGRQSPPAGFATVVFELRFGDPALEEGAGVDARRGMRLKPYEIARLACPEEVIEPDLEKIGDRGISGDVTAELGILAVRAHDHRKCIPAHDRADALLGLEVARELRLVREWNCVAVGRIEDGGQRHARSSCLVE